MDFPHLALSSKSAEASVSRDSSDSQLLKDNKLDILQSQWILQNLFPLSGDSSEAESNQRASKGAGKDNGVNGVDCEIRGGGGSSPKCFDLQFPLRN